MGNRICMTYLKVEFSFLRHGMQLKSNVTVRINTSLHITPIPITIHLSTMSSASYREKCNEVTQVANSEENKQEADNVPAQTINHDSKVNQYGIESQPPPTSLDQMDRVQIQEMQKLASQSAGGNIKNLENGGDSRGESLSHLNNEENDRKLGGNGIRYVTSDDTDKNNQNLRK
ncbi:hypothetical protein CORT_0B08160 [Candida orthopsilosis Co 90-125]|uniref:Uncharacterized protein n=1 Tax=Candida orthopsilosis (strain 90-125) TaxID=1136231 RepID=H8X1W5_CANO9|nr:hypothetical protein CORT_0B08160 [Candida orthopsilosis Co 90-125]CCG22521.1 hypothetical protein CORT_0B08160 [Candida orthopsilosis Co 90-125]